MLSHTNKSPISWVEPVGSNAPSAAHTPKAINGKKTPKKRSWLIRSALVLLALLTIVGASLVVPAKFLGQLIPGQALIDDGAAVSRPGSAQAINDRITVSGRQSYQPQGEFLFTTVSIDVDVTVFDWLEAEINPNSELFPLENILGDRTPAENRSRNLELMVRSKDDAVLAALEYLGLPIEETGVLFGVVLGDGPANDLLQVGDVIVGIDGTAIGSLTDLRAELAKKTPNETGFVTVEAANTGTLKDVAIVWGTHPEGREGAYLGISEIMPRVADNTQGIDVAIDTGSTGGPSAGLAFALAIIDLLTPGELTGNNKVAVTGQIFLGGVVGNVGGVAQKAVAARSAGASAFIVPSELVSEANAHSGEMAVFGVANLDEAVSVLASLGGDTDNLFLS